MRLLRSFPVLAFALVLLSIVGYGIAARSVGLVLLAGALAVMSWYVTEGPRGRHLPKWVANVLFIAAVLSFVVDYMQNPRLEDAMGVLGRFTIWLTLIKLYERKTVRDHSQILALSLLLMLTGSMLSADLLFGAVLAVYSILGLYVLVLFQLHAAYDMAKTARREGSPARYRLVPSVQPIIGRRVGFEFRSLVGAIGIAGFALGVAIFVAFPRGLGQGSVASIAGPIATRRVGFSEELNPTQAGRINSSRRQVLTLRITGPDGTVGPMPGPVLLRGAVFEEYRGDGEWKRLGDPRARRAIQTTSSVFTSLARDDAPVDGPTYSAELDWLVDQAVVFTILTPVAISTEEPQEIAYLADHQTMRRSNDGWLGRYVVRFQTAPTAETLRRVQGLRAAPRSRIGAPMRSRLSRLERRSRELLVEAGLPGVRPADAAMRYRWSRAAAAAFVEFLHGDQFEYTLDLRDVALREGLDPIVQFVTETRRGHCEYYASALALMCQLVDIDARAVTGYLAHGYDSASRSYVVVEGNAHAWCEVRVGEREWQAFDPTPPAAIESHHRIDEGITERLRWIFNNLESNWERRVVSFDSAAQQRMGDSFDAGWSRRMSDVWRTLKEWLESVNRAFYLGPAGYIWMGTVATLLVAAFMTLIHLVRRSRRLRRALALGRLRGAEYRRMLQQLGFYLDMLTVLQRGRLAKPPWRPPLAHAAALADEHPEAASIVRELAMLFYGVRYGGRRMEAVEARAARERVRRLASILKVRA